MFANKHPRWQGDHLPDGSSFSVSDVDASEAALEGGDDFGDDDNIVMKALRANFCPNCAWNVILVDTLIVSSFSSTRFGPDGPAADVQGNGGVDFLSK